MISGHFNSMRILRLFGNPLEFLPVKRILTSVRPQELISVLQVVGKLGFVSDMVAQTIMLSKDVMKSFKLLCAHKDPEVCR